MVPVWGVVSGLRGARCVWCQNGQHPGASPPRRLTTRPPTSGACARAPLPHDPDGSSLLPGNLPRAFSCKIRTRRGEVPGSPWGWPRPPELKGCPRPQVQRLRDDAVIRCG